MSATFGAGEAGGGGAGCAGFFLNPRKKIKGWWEGDKMIKTLFIELNLPVYNNVLLCSTPLVQKNTGKFNTINIVYIAYKLGLSTNTGRTS